MSGRGDRQVLTFRTGGGTFGIDVARCRSILAFSGPCPAPSGCLRGALVVAGERLALVDVAARMGQPATELSGRTCVLVTEGPGMDLALLVEEVGAILELRERDVGVLPKLGRGLTAAHIAGVGDAGGRLILLLDPEHLLEPDEVAAARACTAPESGELPSAEEDA